LSDGRSADHVIDYIRDDFADDEDRYDVLIEAGKIKPAIDRTYPLCDLPTAIRYVVEGRARGKIVITI
jgi:NADPH:quinone reductase-like Zn-dependent oxidoreductase